MRKLAQDLEIGEFVQHNGVTVEVVEVEVRGIEVRVATMSGGHVAFMYNSFVTAH